MSACVDACLLLLAQSGADCFSSSAERLRERDHSADEKTISLSSGICGAKSLNWIGAERI